MEEKRLVEEIVNHRAIESVYPSREAFAAALRSKKKFRIYLGVDPTGPHIHVGHLTNFLVLRKLQDLGAEIIFLIGDFTARIGDPTDKLAARQPLTDKEIKANYASFREQAGRILSFKGKNPVRTLFNAAWLSKMTFADILELTSRVTVQQMVERDMFQERIKAGKQIGLHEFLYPLMQGYDSVAMDVDAEIGGRDQTFNMLMGRDLLKKYKDKEKIVLTTKLLINPVTGKKLMNKSEGGTINLDDSPSDIFGKVMAVVVDSMITVAELSTEVSDRQSAACEKDLKSGRNPRDIKKEVAHAITATVYGEAAAGKAEEQFEKLFSRHEVSGDVPVLVVKVKKLTALELAVASGVLKSKSEARRLIKQGGFELDEIVIKNPSEPLTLRGGEILRVGKKRFFRVG